MPGCWARWWRWSASISEAHRKEREQKKAAQVGAHGAAQSSRTGDNHSYPRISAAELETVWEEIYRFGTSGEAGAQELVDSLSQTNYSVLGGLLRDEYEVWSKPGWYFQDSYDITCTNDAGVVFSDCGP